MKFKVSRSTDILQYISSAKTKVFLQFHLTGKGVMMALFLGLKIILSILGLSLVKQKLVKLHPLKSCDVKKMNIIQLSV
jgi:hypothetical protein